MRAGLPLIAVVGDDESVRESLPDQSRELGSDALELRNVSYETLRKSCTRY